MSVMPDTRQMMPAQMEVEMGCSWWVSGCRRLMPVQVGVGMGCDRWVSVCRGLMPAWIGEEMGCATLVLGCGELMSGQGGVQGGSDGEMKEGVRRDGQAVYRRQRQKNATQCRVTTVEER